jgi:endonuclease/exonuclease/phosphatase family metal-dependent hydrolase
MSLLLAAALSICIAPGVADAAKKKGKADKVGVMSYNLYLGSDLGPALQSALASRTDLFANEVGFVNNDVIANAFDTRAIQIAKDIKNRNVDLVGLQEAALWKVSVPPDLSSRASSTQYDYIQSLLDELNKKAKTAKECKAAKSKAKKAGKKVKPCYQGYSLVRSQQEADIEFPADFDNDPGPDGVTFDVSNSAAFGAAAPGMWLQGNDDTGFNAGEPPAAQCSDGVDNDGAGGADWGTDPQCTGQTDNSEANQAQCSDTVDNDVDTFTDAADPECVDPPGPTPLAFDNSESTAGFQAKPSSLPQDANFDSHAFASTPNGTLDPSGNGTDPVGVADCATGGLDQNPSEGPTLGEGGAWPFTGYDTDRDPATPGEQQPVCMIHGLDGEVSLTMRDAILKRNGAGVKTSNAKGANYDSNFGATLLGSAVEFTRGWVSTDANVRGKKFTFLNTHLESELALFRENQAKELVAPGGPATGPATVLVGDLNSDPAAPTNDGAYNNVAAGGYRSLTGPALTSGHGELLNDTSNTLDGSRIDHILTNSTGIVGLSSQVIDTFANGLWNSDHGGVFVQIKGAKQKAKKKKK